MVGIYSVILFQGSIWQIVQESSTFGVIILLVLVAMSLASWSVIVGKLRQFRKVAAQNESFLHNFKRSRQMDELAGKAKTFKASTTARIYMSGFNELSSQREAANTFAGLGADVKPLTTDDLEMVEMDMEREMTDQLSYLERQVVYLATTASSAPFLGLLGTVVGIMDSFWSIGERGSASLAVVAPGIAEALLATIVGLGAAIPAVIAYNWANNRIKAFRDHSESFILDFMVRVRKEVNQG